MPKGVLLYPLGFSQTRARAIPYSVARRPSSVREILVAALRMISRQQIPVFVLIPRREIHLSGPAMISWQTKAAGCNGVFHQKNEPHYSYCFWITQSWTHQRLHAGCEYPNVFSHNISAAVRRLQITVWKRLFLHSTHLAKSWIRYSKNLNHECRFDCRHSCDPLLFCICYLLIYSVNFYGTDMASCISFWMVHSVFI